MGTGIIILGLGPGAPEHLTRQAWDWLQQCGEIWLRTTHHPTVSAFPADLKVFSFDELYDQSEKFEQVYAAIVERVLELGRRPEGVTYGVPGHPLVAESTGPEILRRARSEGLPVRVIEGISFLEPTFTALGLDPYPNMGLVDALELSSTLTPQIIPSQPMLVAQIYSRQVAANVKLTLNSVYPDEHPVKLVHAAGTDQEKVEDLKLYEIDRSRSIGLLTALYLPPLAADIAFENFQEIIARLRAPDGCPWDREQTHLTLRKHLLEETYEALAALDAEDVEGMREEFGDLLLQIVLHAQIASEEGEFSMADIIQGISQKIVRRHPHVFGDVQVDDVKGVLQNWEKLKAKERKDNGDKKYKGQLDGVPRDFPALAQSQEVQDRAARVGFDWKAVDETWAKVMQAVKAVREAGSPEERSEEMGDLLFAVAGLARWYKVDAESALRGTLLRFRKRFGSMEISARESGKSLSDLKPAELDALWKETIKQV
jgi:tetrapyrrole methylase family protein / MazG family protein